jgi:hypothetical protein
MGHEKGVHCIVACGFPLVVCADMEIYNWDGQTSGPRTDGDADFLAIKLV